MHCLPEKLCCTVVDVMISLQEQRQKLYNTVTKINTHFKKAARKRFEHGLRGTQVGGSQKVEGGGALLFFFITKKKEVCHDER